MNSRAAAVAVMVAVFLVLHALQCATGLDAPRPAVAPVAHALADTGAAGAPVALVDGTDTPAPVLTHGHHEPADDGGIAVTACLILLVAAGAVLLDVLRRWVLRVAAGRKLTPRVQGRLSGGFSLAQLCVLRT
ncbi:hypothetical protein [Micromonospora sp. 4G55]|uniref:hypothetical protein n=1 Tax=Micromonospora sp. 4G55 TaxID=2806102 RepID=UPI001A393F5B|nr:hypothetical protein [Micromonospora sp. 4G55]MBM0257681.1 hypothetical protein [Micromonospora sp. 4G55]MBM0257704.1 hypothetical protein [Micromonospora sp. 4G55]